MNTIELQIEEHSGVVSIIRNDAAILNQIKLISDKCITAYKNGNKTFFGGNGGSAADAQHLAAEFIGKFAFHRDGLPSIALTTNTSVITAIANDYEYNEVFARQIQAFGKNGDIFFGISTSGNSKIVNKALELSKVMGIITVGMTGISGGAMTELCDYCIKIPSQNTPRIQEAHILIGHIICSIVESSLFVKGTV